MKRYTILVVDDEKSILYSIKHVLKNENYHILTAQNGIEGLALLKKHIVQLVISDHKMPGMTGVEFLKQVKILYPEILTIILTAYDDTEIAIDAINEAGVYKFILKPWENNDLIITIRRALESLELASERDKLLKRIHVIETTLKDLENEHPGISKIVRDEGGYIISEDDASVQEIKWGKKDS
jgi:DNA-binding NtrC family response regulator